MPERTRRLHETLSALLEQLRSEDLRDEHLEQDLPELERVHSEISRILSEDEPQALPESLGERVRESARAFEERHPQLTMLTGRVMDALAEMGL